MPRKQAFWPCRSGRYVLYGSVTFREEQKGSGSQKKNYNNSIRREWFCSRMGLDCGEHRVRPLYSPGVTSFRSSYMPKALWQSGSTGCVVALASKTCCSYLISALYAVLMIFPAILKHLCKNMVELNPWNLCSDGYREELEGFPLLIFA